MIALLRRLLGGDPSPLDMLEKRIGHRFKNRDLLIQALTHSSYAREHKGTPDNERLEFLGDAVVQLVATEHVFKRSSDREGDMTKARAALVSASGLLHIAERLTLSEHVLLGRGERKSGGARKMKILEDCTESIVGAIFQDGGIRAARKFLLAQWSGVDQLPAPADHKTTAQEFFQRERGVAPKYRVIQTAGPAHARRFSVEMLVREEVVGRGEGTSIKAAEQAAAREALGRWRQEPRSVSPTSATSRSAEARE